MNTIPVPATFRIIAHRGASAYAPENTLKAFALARDMGVGEVETDAQLTTDGEVVLCHDSTLARYGHGDLWVESLSSQELLALDMGAWYSPYLFADTPILTLDQLLGEFKDELVYHIELKGAAVGLAAAVDASVTRHGLSSNVIYTSFSFIQLERMREVAADARMGWLVEDFDDETLARARDLQLFQLCPRADRITEELVVKGKEVVSEIRAWGMRGGAVELRALIAQVSRCGCDGMTINWPDWAKSEEGNPPL